MIPKTNKTLVLDLVFDLLEHPVAFLAVGLFILVTPIIVVCALL